MRIKFKRSPQNKREQERCFNLMNKGRDLISMTQGWDWGGMNNSLIQFFRDPSWKMFRTPINRRRDLLKPWQSAMLLSCILILLITGLFFLMSFWKFMDVGFQKVPLAHDTWRYPPLQRLQGDWFEIYVHILILKPQIDCLARIWFHKDDTLVQQTYPKIVNKR